MSGGLANQLAAVAALVGGGVLLAGGWLLGHLFWRTRDWRLTLRALVSPPGGALVLLAAVLGSGYWPGATRPLLGLLAAWLAVSAVRSAWGKPSPARALFLDEHTFRMLVASLVLSIAAVAPTLGSNFLSGMFSTTGLLLLALLVGVGLLAWGVVAAIRHLLALGRSVWRTGWPATWEREGIRLLSRGARVGSLFLFFSVGPALAIGLYLVGVGLKWLDAWRQSKPLPFSADLFIPWAWVVSMNVDLIADGWLSPSMALMVGPMILLALVEGWLNRLLGLASRRLV